MIYVRDLAAMAGLTLVVAGSLPMAAGLMGKTLPGAGCQMGNEPDPVVRNSSGRMLSTGATPQICVCSVECDLTSADDAGIDSAFI